MRKTYSMRALATRAKVSLDAAYAYRKRGVPRDLVAYGSGSQERYYYPAVRWLREQRDAGDQLRGRPPKERE